jgi:Gene product 88
MGLFSINRKMRNSRNEKYKKIVNFTLPAFMTKDGFKTCPNAGACATGCYARQGAYIWPKVYAKHRANLEVTLNPDFDFIALNELHKLKPDLVRIHDSGDFYDADYLVKWIIIATSMPNITFYAYTKMVDLVSRYVLPKNMIIIYSLGGKEDHLIDQDRHRHSRVFSNAEDLVDAGYIDTSHDDTLALGPNPKIGLVYHGQKGYDKTLWKSVKTKTASKSSTPMVTTCSNSSISNNSK